MESVTNIILNAKFGRDPKVRVPAGYGVVTAVDAAEFTGFQILYYSLTLSHEIEVVAGDAGMTSAQRDWCHRHNITVMTLPDHGQKPACFRLSPFQTTLYLDPDTVVTEPLTDVFLHLDERPFFVLDHYRPLGDRELIYQRFPVPVRGTRPVSEAVVGLRKGRDDAVLGAWEAGEERGQAVPSLGSGWTLMWAVESLDLLGTVREESTFHFPVPPDHYHNLDVLLQRLCGGSRVLHFHGHPKPWASWSESVEMDRDGWAEELHDRLRVFVVGDGEFTVPLPFQQAVDLSSTPLGSYQIPLLGDSRFFHSDLVETTPHEYVGCVSRGWDRRYPGAIRLADFHRIKPLLSENVVVAGGVQDPRGLPFVDEIERITGVAAGEVSVGGTDFVCHRQVFRQFTHHYRGLFPRVYDAADPWRVPAAVYEAITVHYFSTRNDLKIVPLV